MDAGAGGEAGWDEALYGHLIACHESFDEVHQPPLSWWKEAIKFWRLDSNKEPQTREY